MIDYDAQDALNAATAAWKEARGDGNMAMRAVLHVISNRVGQPGFGSTVHDVVYGKNQFTSMSVPSDPEYNLDPEQSVGADRFAWYYCQGVVGAILEGADPDITNGACYYGRLSQVTSGWFWSHIVNDPANHPVTAKLGHQIFYK